MADLFAPELVVVAGLLFLAYTTRGITGAASAIVFNSLFAVALAAGLTGHLTLLDGLYWIALADLLASFVMAAALWRTMRLESFTLRLLAGSVPVNVLFTLALPSLSLPLLGAGLAVALVASGAYLAGQTEIRRVPDTTLRRWALPAGMATGVLGGLYGMSGPIAVIFLSHAGDDPSQFRRRVTLLSVAWAITRVSVLLLSGAIGPPTVARFAVTAPRPRPDVPGRARRPRRRRGCRIARAVPRGLTAGASRVIEAGH
jgi:hypothetical protein